MTGNLIPWPRRLPIAVTALLALYALYRMEGFSTAIPIWAGLIIVSLIVPARIPDTAAAVWLARLPVFSLAVLSNLSRPVDIVNMFDVRTMTWFGELCAAELALACWIQAPSDHRPTRPLWLAGLVMLAASSTPDETFIALVAPPFFLALLVALRANSAPGPHEPPVRPHVPWRYGIAVACALLGGTGISAILTLQRNALTAWGMQLLGEHVQYESGALSTNPNLTSTFGQRGSSTRAMRIDGDGEFSHLRGVAFVTYNGGSWGREGKTQFAKRR